MDSTEESTVQGYVDGYSEGRIRGWAWRPDYPHETVTVEVLIDGVLIWPWRAWATAAMDSRCRCNWIWIGWAAVASS